MRISDWSSDVCSSDLIVDDYARAYPKRWLAIANRLLPPNVFPIGYRGLAAKYAVLSLADFRRLASSDTLNVSVWARFAQPSRLVWAASAAIAEAIAKAVASAAPAPLRLAAQPSELQSLMPIPYSYIRLKTQQNKK